MRFQHKLLSTALMAAGFIGAAQAAPLEEELRSVLGQHPLIRAASKSTESAANRTDVAKAALFPKITFARDTGNEYIKGQGYVPGTAVNGVIPSGADGKMVDNPTESDLTRHKSTFTIEQNLYSGGRTFKGIEMAKLDKAAQDANFDAVTQEVMMEAISAYLQVVRYQTLINLTKLNEQTTQRQLDLETQRVERGGGIAVDAMQAKTRLQIVKERRVFYEQGLRDAVASYEQVFGKAPNLETFQDLDTFNAVMPKSLESAIMAGLERNPRLRAANMGVRKAQIQIGNERAGYAPSVDLVATQVKDRNAGGQARREEQSVLLKMNWTLFSGLDTRAKVQAAQADYEEQQAKEANLQNKTKESIRLAWNQLMNGRERLELLEAAASTSREVMQNRKRLRDAGKETALIVLDAEVEYFGVLANKLNAMIDTRIGSYRLLSAMGQIDPATLGLQGGQFLLPVMPLSESLKKLANYDN